MPPLTFTLKRMLRFLRTLTPFVTPRPTPDSTFFYEPPSMRGDRLCDAVAASTSTCALSWCGLRHATNFEVVTADRKYLGGVITPGITISTNALFERAARLPRVEIKRPDKVIGSSTVGAMQSGLYYGYIGLVDGILRRMIEELSTPARVVATGGLAPLIAAGSELIETVDDTLTLEGLRLISN